MTTWRVAGVVAWLSGSAAMAAMGTTLLAPVLLTQEARIEDATKGVGFFPPESFYYSDESEPSSLVLRGPRLAGRRARLEVHRLLDGRPGALVLDEFLTTTLEVDPGSERTPWPVSRRDDVLGPPFIVDHVHDRKRVRAGLVATRHGPYVLIVRAEATPAHFDQLEPAFHDVLRDLELLPLEATWMDDGMDVRLYWLPDWLEEDPDEVEPGMRGAWIWQSPDKELTATMQIETRPAAPDAEEGYDKYYQQLLTATSLEDIDRRDTWVSDKPAVVFKLTDRGGNTRWELFVQQDDRLVVASLECPTHFAGESIETAFEQLTQHMTVHER